MANINMPSKPKDRTGSLLTLAGAGAGAALGGPAGAGIGMGLGQSLGQMQAANQPQGAQPVQESQSAVQRRLAQLDETPLAKIRQGLDALQFVEDPAQRVELAKPLLQAEMVAKRNPYGIG